MWKNSLLRSGRWQERGGREREGNLGGGGEREKETNEGKKKKKDSQIIGLTSFFTSLYALSYFLVFYLGNRFTCRWR
jgi:hypothetical protein